MFAVMHLHGFDGCGVVANVFPPQKNTCCSTTKRLIYGEEKKTPKCLGARAEKFMRALPVRLFEITASNAKKTRYVN